MPVYYFGRGSSNCLAFEPIGGNYARISIGNRKTEERGASILFDLCQTDALIGFLGALKESRVEAWLEAQFGGDASRFVEDA